MTCVISFRPMVTKIYFANLSIHRQNEFQLKNEYVTSALSSRLHCFGILSLLGRKQTKVQVGCRRKSEGDVNNASVYEG